MESIVRFDSFFKNLFRKRVKAGVMKEPSSTAQYSGIVQQVSHHCSKYNNMSKANQVIFSVITDTLANISREKKVCCVLLYHPTVKGNISQPVFFDLNTILCGFNVQIGTFHDDVPQNYEVMTILVTK